MYGLEMLAIIATVFAAADFLGHKNVSFYIDNSNWRDALVRLYTKTSVVERAVKLFRP